MVEEGARPAWWLRKALWRLVTITGVGHTGVDNDHPVEYDTHGPPGQTRDANTQPLTRTHHRAKTHLPYQVWIIDTTTKLWRTPNNLWRIVDHHGTHHPEVLELGPELLAG